MISEQSTSTEVEIQEIKNIFYPV